MGIASAWGQLQGHLVAPWQLAQMGRKAATWHTIAGAAEMVAAQCHGGVTVVTPAAGEEAGAQTPVALRSLIQLDGDVLLMIDRSWLARQEAQGPEALEQALARHRAQISATLAPLRQGFETATRVMILAGRSRWSVLGLGGLSQGGALVLAPSFSATSLSAWLSAAAGQLEVVLLQALSLALLAVFGGVRLVLRWWIRRRIGARLDNLLQRSDS
jgi:hypothetical protein